MKDRRNRVGKGINSLAVNSVKRRKKKKIRRRRKKLGFEQEQEH